MVVMELANNGALDSYLQKNNVPVEKKLEMIVQSAWGIEYLHSREVLHRDIAARNCLYGDNKVEISDFGLTREGTVYQMDPHCRVPIRWLAPETLRSAIYTQKSDVFAYGIMCWEILNNGIEPYPGMSVAEVNVKVKEGFRMELPPELNSDVKMVVEIKCWSDNPNERFVMKEISKNLERILKIDRKKTLEPPEQQQKKSVVKATTSRTRISKTRIQHQTQARMAQVDNAVQDLTKQMENSKLSSKGDRDRGRFSKNPLNEEIEVLYAEKLNGLKIVQEKATGKVKWYSVLRHFGFIEIDSASVKDENTDVFVHQYSIIESRTRRRCYRTLEDGEAVQFDIADGEKGREAVNVTGLDGEPVVGSRYQMLQAPWMRRAFFQHRQEMSSRKDDKSGDVKSRDRRPSNGAKGEKRGKRVPNRRRPSLKSETDKKREESHDDPVERGAAATDGKTNN
ncbi:unnamed protein product, partial [Mesorhabditis belari]|uniref:Non-specific protein-tyrosine kinase n=1 Tax=Mesorhabditis belari TaxID=2138241 RepID=A0AAF3J9Q1_9BILA